MLLKFPKIDTYIAKLPNNPVFPRAYSNINFRKKKKKLLFIKKQEERKPLSLKPLQMSKTPNPAWWLGG